MGGYHPGEDWNLVGNNNPKADVGKPVYAIANGSVFRVSSLGSSGDLVILEHEGIFTIPGRSGIENGEPYSYPTEIVDKIYSVYVHLTDVQVSKEQDPPQCVSKGEVIGYIFDPQPTLGPHLHFEIRHPSAAHSPNGSMVEPEPGWCDTNWVGGCGNPNGYYTSPQGMVDGGLRDPRDFLRSMASRAIAVGDAHTCALTATGGLKCWGWNSDGQLGDGTSGGFSSTPVDVCQQYNDIAEECTELLSGVAALGVGGRHTCAVTEAGGVKCSGWNNRGQLGDGTATRRTTPVDVCQDYDDVAEECTELLSGVAAVAGGWVHTCALTTVGGVKCWGWNNYGQLGAVSTGSCGFLQGCSTTPVDVLGLGSGVAAVAAGLSHTCALTTGGSVKCWGRNNLGQLGDGTGGPGDSSFSPLDACQEFDEVAEQCLQVLSGVAAVAAGGWHNCALGTAGGVKCWGNNSSGPLGDGTAMNRPTPVDVCQNYDDVAEECTELLSGVAAVAAGYLHTCVLTTAGGVKCWGTKGGMTPVDVTGLGSGVAAVTTGGFGGPGHTCALTTAGGVKCRGSNSFGQLGDGTTTNRSTAVGVVGLPLDIGTPVGAAVVAPLGSAVKVTFENVTGAGTTTLTSSTTGASPPDGFMIGNPPVYYEMSTTATFSGTVEVCVYYDDSTFPLEAGVRLFHWEDSAWADVTTSLDTDTNRICGTVTSLSPFLPAQDLAVGGIAELPEIGETQVERRGSSGRNVRVLALSVAAIALAATAFGAGAWYVRLRRR